MIVTWRTAPAGRLKFGGFEINGFDDLDEEEIESLQVGFLMQLVDIMHGPGFSDALEYT